MLYWSRELPFVDVVIPEGTTMERLFTSLSSLPTHVAYRHMEEFLGWRIIPHHSQWDLFKEPSPTRKKLGWNKCGEPLCNKGKPYCVTCYQYFMESPPQMCLGKSKASLVCTSCKQRCNLPPFDWDRVHESLTSPSSRKTLLAERLRGMGMTKEQITNILKHIA